MKKDLIDLEMPGGDQTPKQIGDLTSARDRSDLPLVRSPDHLNAFSEVFKSS
jgi:hypothetical protein